MDPQFGKWEKNSTEIPLSGSDRKNKSLLNRTLLPNYIIQQVLYTILGVFTIISENCL